MFKIVNPVVSIGEPLKIDLTDVESSVWAKISDIEMIIQSDEGDPVWTFSFLPERHLEILTDQIDVGSYDLVVSFVGTPFVFAEPIVIGVRDMHDRVTRFFCALDQENLAKRQSGIERVATLAEVEKTYADLDLTDLADEVRRELLRREG